MAAGVGTQSRAALVAVVGMILIAVLTGLLALRYAGALLAVVTTGVALVISVLPLSIGEAIADPDRYSDTSIAQRNDLRLTAFEMTRASPVVGLGPGAFPLFHQDYRDDDHYQQRDLDTAYSTVLETSAELGLLGVLALYAAWMVPAVAARRRWRRDRSRLTAGVAAGPLRAADRLGAGVRALRPPAVVHGCHGARAGPSQPHPASALPGRDGRQLVWTGGGQIVNFARRGPIVGNDGPGGGAS